MPNITPFLVCIIFANSLLSQTRPRAIDTLPFSTIPAYPEKTTPEAVVARMIEGLGFRYYWATEGLRPQDLAFRPSEGARTTEETIDHILGLSTVILNAFQHITTVRSGEETSTLSFVVKRKITLSNLKIADDLLRTGQVTLDSANILFKNGDKTNTFPFWTLLNGPIEDAVWHVGQVVSFRRSSGNSLPPKLNLLMGTAPKLEVLRSKINQITATKKAEVGVAILGGDGSDTLTLRGGQHFPMQSVFKFHIALAVLAAVDKGQFSLQQKITIDQKDLLPDLYSPLREKYPKGTRLPLSELLEYAVAKSDNVACDALLRLVGGPKAVEDYFIGHNFSDISIKINEAVMQQNWDLQFQNWTTPQAANTVLSKFFDTTQTYLSKTSYDFIWKVMTKTETGPKRLKGNLPEGTVVAHKTGWSGARDGITAAVNDMGIVYLPDGRHFFIIVFVTNSSEDFDTNEKIIADVSKVVWDYFISK